MKLNGMFAFARNSLENQPGVGGQSAVWGALEREGICQHPPRPPLRGAGTMRWEGQVLPGWTKFQSSTDFNC